MTNSVLAVLVGGAAVAILDGIAATIDFRIRGISLTRLWQGVASGAFGAASFQRGNATVLLGLAFHVLIATTAALVFNVAASYAPVLLAYYILSGVLYGIVVFIFMNLVVLPLSALPPRPFSLGGTIRQVVIHMVCVGLPISLAAHWFATK
jgi:uncharacterized membrane protein YagU involved in acid resistance